jgi:hypothetical protein
LGCGIETSRLHKVVQVRVGSLRPLEPPEAYTDVPRRL